MIISVIAIIVSFISSFIAFLTYSTITKFNEISIISNDKHIELYWNYISAIIKIFSDKNDNRKGKIRIDFIKTMKYIDKEIYKDLKKYILPDLINYNKNRIPKADYTNLGMKVKDFFDKNSLIICLKIVGNNKNLTWTEAINKALFD